MKKYVRIQERIQALRVKKIIKEKIVYDEKEN